ncbi:MAG: hypothetical protein SPH02_07525 [Campylobacter sp.]|nr:hypothetical protein [Campylobacter sp.]
MRLLRFARNDENSRIPYRDPPVKLGDDTRTLGDDGCLGILKFLSKF